MVSSLNTSISPNVGWVQLRVATPLGPSHWNTGIPVTPLGRVTEQVRLTVSPTKRGKEGGELTDILAGSKSNDKLC